MAIMPADGRRAAGKSLRRPVIVTGQWSVEGQVMPESG